MNSYPLRIPISELPNETRITIPRKAWTLWGTECKVIDIEGDFCRLEFYPEGQEVRRNQEVFIALDGVSVQSLIDKLTDIYGSNHVDTRLFDFIQQLSELLPNENKPADDDTPTP